MNIATLSNWGTGTYAADVHADAAGNVHVRFKRLGGSTYTKVEIITKWFRAQ